MASKRANGEGSIKQLPSGQWYAQVMDGHKLDGSRNLVYFKGHTKREVIGQIREYWKRRELGAVPDCDVSFSEWADIWYQDYEGQVQPSTYSGYRFTLKIVKVYFGQRKVQQIKPLEIHSFVDYMNRAGYSKSRKAKIRRVLPGMQPPRGQKGKDAFSAEERDFLARRLRGDLLGNSIMLMIGTGLRTQELLALSPDDIATDGSYLNVSKAIKLVNGAPTLGPPKSEKGRRIIPVPEDYRRYALYLRYCGGKTYIWTSQRENGLFDPGVFRKQYYKAISDIPEVRRLSPHCCRHTYITMLEQKGVPMEQIARLAGHSRISTTDGYLHLDIETLVGAVSVLNARTQ